MLEIFNVLKPFFDDCYGEISVREYSRLMGMSAPTASVWLKMYESEGLLKRREDRGYMFFRADRDSDILRDLSRIYWKIELTKVVNEIRTELHNPTIVLFGSLSKLEAKKDSDIDIAIISKTAKKINLENFEKQLGRRIQVFYFKSFGEISDELRINIINGYVLGGRLE